VKALALDPSKGTDAHRGDYSAFISLAVDFGTCPETTESASHGRERRVSPAGSGSAPKGVLYVQADMARRPTPQMVADGVEIYRQFQPHIFGVEANQFQELLAPEFETAFRSQGLLGVHPWLIHNDANKRVRIRRLGPLLAARRIRLKANCPSTKLLFHQLQEFPIADHDDGPDALEMALRLASELLAGRHRSDGLGNRLPVG
jgi:predicted phage terminase large subunit-like protein